MRATVLCKDAAKAFANTVCLAFCICPIYKVTYNEFHAIAHIASNRGYCRAVPYTWKG